MESYNICSFLSGPFQRCVCRMDMVAGSFPWVYNVSLDGLTQALLLFGIDVCMVFTWSSCVCCRCSLSASGDVAELAMTVLSLACAACAVCPMCTFQPSVPSSHLYCCCWVKPPVVLKMLITFLRMTGHTWAVGKLPLPSVPGWRFRKPSCLSFSLLVILNCYFLTILWVAFFSF